MKRYVEFQLSGVQLGVSAVKLTEGDKSVSFIVNWTELSAELG